MTMQLLGPWVTTTRYTNKKRKNKSERQLQAEREHDAWLRKRGLAPDQLKEVLPHNAKGKRVGVYKIPTYKTETNSLPTSDRIAPVAGKRKANVYTGDEIAGIGVMHKSNAVPIRKDSNAAKEIASMRR